MSRLARRIAGLIAVSALALLAAAAQDSSSNSSNRTPSQIGVQGGSLPPDGSVPAVEHVPPLQGLPRFGVGRPATAEDIRAWDIDVRYDGAGLPPGEGGVEVGTEIFDEKCAVCHGDFGQGEGRWPVLVGGFDSLTHQGGRQRPEKTVGSYWPYAPTLYDYIRRTMPYNAPQTLTDEETYALVAYLLYLNNLVKEDFIASAETLRDFPMPNAANFFPDPRPDVQNTACMKDCIDESQIALIESIRGVTPVEHLQTDAEAAEEKPAAAASAKADAPAEVKQHYQQFCAVCHDSGVADAPKLDDGDAWRQRLEAAGGRAALVQSAIAGKGAMPPKGGAVNLSDEQIGALVDYLLESADN